MKRFNEFLSFLLCSLCWMGCNSELTKNAGGNKLELEKTLAYYKWIDRDSLKLEAACFLIENMQYHYSKGKIADDRNEELKRWMMETDSVCYSEIGGLSLDSIPWDSLKTKQIRRQEQSKERILPEAIGDDKIYNDSEHLTSDFLIDHIDNAFRVWKTSRFTRNLSFEDFKEYLLPYRSVSGYGYLHSGKDYNQLFAKYVLSDTTVSLRDAVDYYNTTVNILRDFNGKTGRKRPAGLFDLYSRDAHDCVDIASYGCNILRACGIPVVVEHNVCYRNLSGRHYHCSAYSDSLRHWQTFNPESSLPGDGDWAFAEVLNVYRQMYGAQKNTPFFLKATDEYIPPQLGNPCIKDVTRLFLPTISLELPFSAETNNRLAYLATFHKESGGLMAVTWGRIDSVSRRVRFENVIPGMLYFPIYYPEKDFRLFGSPFYVVKQGKRALVHILPFATHSSDTLPTLVLTRKFPQKTSMREVADRLIGGRFLGANKPDFSDAMTLYEIKKSPPPSFCSYPLTHTGRYRYYRFQAPDSFPNANISMLEWVTDKRFNYSNTLPTTRPHVTSPANLAELTREKNLVKLLDAPTWEEMKWKSEYDGNMQTAPSAYPNITLNLKEPQVVRWVRFAPRNADNGIKPGQEYRLWYWTNMGWKLFASARAEYEYIAFSGVPANTLYWLENRSEGNEEMPFVIDKGRQVFLYEGLIPNGILKTHNH